MEAIKLNQKPDQAPLSAGICSSDDGRIWEVTDAMGNKKTLRFDKPLSNGTLLSSSENGNLLTTIQNSLLSVFSGVNATITSSEKLAAVYGDQYAFVYWMVDHDIDSFDSTSELDLEAFLEDAAQGIDVIFGSREKVWDAMLKLKMQKANVNAYSTSEILTLSNLFAHPSSFPGACEAIKDFKAKRTKLRKSKPRKGVSQGKLYNRTRAISILHAYSAKDDDKFPFIPFEDGSGSLVLQLGRDGGRTPLIPAPAALTLMEQAANWVLNIAPALLKLRTAFADTYRTQKTSASTRREKQESLLKAFNDKYRHALPEPVVLDHSLTNGGLSLWLALNCFLPSACYICATTLTGRRNMEVSSIEAGACSGTNASGFWIKTYIAKTLRKVDYTPCSRLVVEAIEVLQMNNEKLRETSGSNKLFNIPTLCDDSKGVWFDAASHIDRFARYVGASNLGMVGNTPWHIAPHQLRKLFAVLYIWRYDGGDLDALSYHLRHFDLNMTVRYCGDRELFGELARQAFSLTKKKIQTMAEKSQKFAGTFAKKLSKLVTRFISEIEFSTSENLEKSIENLIIERGITLKATPWGFCGCKNSKSNLKRAACQQESNASRGVDWDGAPNPSGSDEVRCAKCMFFASDETRVIHWTKQCVKTKDAVASATTVRLQRVKLEKHLHILESFTLALSGGKS
ncbi:hypothetical protein [Paraburkholderia sp. BL25I1N1]|uniref:hypothetical protein n=1 Tax=Paraburkholderia sp. BL25I1N1 TaxID=1938804 RepID=UPI000D4B3960|nr:hypothetical protein [Paraburkholderia sp. BL25I1N1]PRY04696.1 hypothetical protein B0G73_11111 [Paraburkholderia sp. BL25I1N1]